MVATFKECAVLALLALTNAASLRRPIRPSDDSFYKATANIEDVRPGTILKHRKPPSPIAAFKLARTNLKDSHQILYKTIDSLNTSVATVLTVLVPHNANFGKVLSYQFFEDAATFDSALDRGWVVIAPDHQGPKAAFLANALAGHAVLDSIRAATRSTSFTGIHDDPTVVIWGYSGGSLATGWAAELQPSYAPEVKIVGAALGGTVPNLMNVLTSINKGVFAGLLPSGLLGLAHQYPEIAELIEKHLHSEEKPKLSEFEQQCFTSNLVKYAFKDGLAAFDDREILQKQPAAQIIKGNDMGKANPRIPLYIYKGILDEVSPIADTDELVENYCRNGASVEYVREKAAAHAVLFVTGAAKAVAWLAGVMDGTKPKHGCSTKNVTSSLLDSSAKAIPGFIRRALLNLLGRPVGPAQDTKTR